MLGLPYSLKTILHEMRGLFIPIWLCLAKIDEVEMFVKARNFLILRLDRIGREILMKTIVTGATGQLGHDLIVELDRRGHKAIGTARKMPKSLQDSECFVKLDITDENAVKEIIASCRPDAIIHCAAWTAVDEAEDEENRSKVYDANVMATAFFAEAAKSVDAKMLYLSTDYVFDGQGTRPWEPDDKCFAPLNYYGKTKLEGELAVSSILEKYYIARIAWVFGLNGKNFIKTIIDVGKTHDEVRVVSDQIGTPTYTKDLARLLVDMVETDRYGYYHATNSEGELGSYISWADLAEEAYRAAGMNTKVVRVSTEEYGLSKAVRPHNSRLDKRKLMGSGFVPLPPWKDAVRRYIEEAGLYA